MTTGPTNFFERLLHIFRTAGLWWGLAISLALAIGSLALATAIVVGWRPDHFKGDHAVEPELHPVLHLARLVGRNLVGAIVVLLGVVMALPGIPGQGLLTIAIGITLLSFPGKRRLERRLIGHASVLHAINRLRARFHRPPLEL